MPRCGSLDPTSPCLERLQCSHTAHGSALAEHVGLACKALGSEGCRRRLNARVALWATVYHHQPSEILRHDAALGDACIDPSGTETLAKKSLRGYSKQNCGALWQKLGLITLSDLRVDALQRPEQGSSIPGIPAAGKKNLPKSLQGA